MARRAKRSLIRSNPLLRRTPLAALCFLLFFPAFPVSSPCTGLVPSDVEGIAASGPEHPAGGLSRFPDPVLVKAEWLSGFEGARIRDLRLYACRDGVFEPIRFQVDERTEQGDWIFPHGKRNNGRKSNGRLDVQDVILFMARDASGDTCAERRPAGIRAFTEILLHDPVDGSQGSVVLALHEEPAPPLCRLPAYVHYDPVNEVVSSASMKSEYLITDGGLHTGFYKSRTTPPGAGGTGENYVDRLKLRGELRFFFNLIPLTLSEERQGSDVIAYIQGPVRVLRRQEQFVKLPFGIRGIKGIADIAIFENLGTVPVKVNIPKGFQHIVSSAHVELGTDYAPAVIGSFYRNSENPEPLLIDGRMSESEKRFCTKLDSWRIFYGPCGVLMTRTFFPRELMETVDIRQGYLDDVRIERPPERFAGSMGYAYTEGRPIDVRPGRYIIPLDFYYPMNYQPGDELDYMKIRDHPLRIRIQGREYTNPLDLPAEGGEDF